MSDLVDLIVEVDGTDIVVKMPGTTNLAIYHKPNGSPQLRVRGSGGTRRVPRAHLDAGKRCGAAITKEAATGRPRASGGTIA